MTDTIKKAAEPEAERECAHADQAYFKFEDGPYEEMCVCRDCGKAWVRLFKPLEFIVLDYRLKKGKSR